MFFRVWILKGYLNNENIYENKNQPKLSV